MTHMRGLRAVLTVPRIVDHHHPAAMRGGRRIGEQQTQPAAIDLFRIPPGFGEDELQPLHRPMLRPEGQLGLGQRGQRLVPASAERFPLLDDISSHRLMSARCRLGGRPSVTQLL
jgi:hypothetical protein